MAVAQMVIDCDPTHLNWLRIEDNHGDVWRYEKKAAVDHAAVAHVEGHSSKVTTLPDATGLASRHTICPDCRQRQQVHLAPSCTKGLR